MIFYFSGLGNSKYIAEQIAEAGERTFFIPDMEREQRYCHEPGGDERLGFVFPVYAWRAPRLVSAFVEKLQLRQKPAYTFMVATCGDDCAKTETYFRKTLRHIGLTLDAALSVQMPNTYVNLPGMDVDPTELCHRKLNAAETRIQEIRNILHHRQKISQMTVAGMPSLKSDIIQPIFYKLLVKSSPFHSTDACVSCGICAAHCPLHNIELVDGRPKWHHDCTTCMSCYHHCPQHAIHFGNATQGKGQYYFGR